MCLIFHRSLSESITIYALCSRRHLIYYYSFIIICLFFFAYFYKFLLICMFCFCPIFFMLCMQSSSLIPFCQHLKLYQKHFFSSTNISTTDQTKKCLTKPQNNRIRQHLSISVFDQHQSKSLYTHTKHMIDRPNRNQKKKLPNKFDKNIIRLKRY